MINTQQTQKEVRLIGVNHIDPRGPERLRTQMEAYKPEVITLEADQELFFEMDNVHQNTQKYLRLPNGKELINILAKETFSSELLKNANPDSVVNFYKAMGYECWIAAEYALSHPGTRIKFVDSKELTDTAMGEIGDSALTEIAQYLALPPQEYQRRIDEDYAHEESDVAATAKISERNITMAAGIISVGNKRTLHVGGLEHSFGNSPNMYELLRKFGTPVSRIKLIDIEKR